MKILTNNSDAGMKINVVILFFLVVALNYKAPLYGMLQQVAHDERVRIQRVCQSVEQTVRHLAKGEPEEFRDLLIYSVCGAIYVYRVTHLGHGNTRMITRAILDAIRVRSNGTIPAEVNDKANQVIMDSFARYFPVPANPQEGV